MEEKTRWALRLAPCALTDGAQALGSMRCNPEAVLKHSSIASEPTWDPGYSEAIAVWHRAAGAVPFYRWHRLESGAAPHLWWPFSLARTLNDANHFPFQETSRLQVSLAIHKICPVEEPSSPVTSDFRHLNLS